MRQKLTIFIGFFLLLVILIGLNAATYVQREKTPDTETEPNRSTYNSGVTGTQAFYTLLFETGRNVTRWRSTIDVLRTEKRDPVTTFVIMGPTRRPFDETEWRQLFEWVNEGGRLVVADRAPPPEMTAFIKGWDIKHNTNDLELIFGIDPADRKQMTDGMSASRPVQPSLFTRNINAVQTSRFASHISAVWKGGQAAGSSEDDLAYPPEIAPYDAPVVHLVGGQRNILTDIKYGSGSVVFLADPYVLSNGGIQLVDNARLGINIVTAGGGLIAFDEYHQGFGSNQNRLLQYFAGTPVTAIFLQVALVAGLILISRSRRFARPIPEPEPDRLSKLEYVSAMAELQRRTKAYDLAIENIYGEFRRRASNLFGLDSRATGPRELATKIAERIIAEPDDLEGVFRRAEDIAHGDATNRKETVSIAARLREIESELGLSGSHAGRTHK